MEHAASERANDTASGTSTRLICQSLLSDYIASDAVDDLELVQQRTCILGFEVALGASLHSLCATPAHSFILLNIRSAFLAKTFILRNFDFAKP